jgi:trk system potassium uptake protein TrkA
MTLSDLAFPANVVISAVLRDDTLILPKGDTVLEIGDEVIALSDKGSEEAFRQMMTGA